MAIKNFPCKNCTHRTAGCHSYCDDYNRAKFVYEKDKEYEQRLRDVNNYIIAATIRLNNNYKNTNFRRNHVND